MVSAVRMKEIKEKSPGEIITIAAKFENPQLAHRDMRLIFAAELRDIAKDKLVVRADRLMISGNLERAELVLSGAVEQASLAGENRRIARRVRGAQDAARKKQKAYA